MELGTVTGGRGGHRRGGGRTNIPTPMDEEIVPNSGWTEDSSCHYLLVDLPGFRKDEVKLEVDDSGHIIVRGERLTNEQKRLHFEQIFEVPNDSDMDNISGHIDSEILYVHVPKLIISSSQENNRESEITEEEAAKNDNVDERVVAEEHINNADNNNHNSRGQSQQNHRERKEKEEIRKNEYENNAFVDDFSEVIRKWERESSSGMFSRSGGAVEVLLRNRGIVITAVIAFSFGLYVSHKFHTLTAP